MHQRAGGRSSSEITSVLRLISTPSASFSSRVLTQLNIFWVGPHPAAGLWWGCQMLVFQSLRRSLSRSNQVGQMKNSEQSMITVFLGLVFHIDPPPPAGELRQGTGAADTNDPPQAVSFLLHVGEEGNGAGSCLRYANDAVKREGLAHRQTRLGSQQQPPPPPIVNVLCTFWGLSCPFFSVKQRPD